MDKVKLFVKFLLLLFVLHAVDALSIDDSVDEDDDESPPWSRCPFIRNKLKNGRVKLRSRGRIAKFMCDPGYELAGRRFITCVRGQWNNPMPVCVSRGCFRPPPVSNARVSETYRGAVLFYECLPGYIIHGGANVYCDGRQWTSEAPTCEVATTSPMLSCDFEDPDLCGWSHDPTHDFDWKRNQFATPSGHVGTGPTSDHTFGQGKGGFYLYMEASSPRKVNDTARLFSPVYTKEKSGGCFVFWYHMFGSTTGGLRVYVKPESHVFGELSPIWTEFGDQGNRWFRGNVTVPQFGENFQIVIEGIRGSSYIGDTAIDDVNLRSEDCSLIGNFSHHTSEYLSTSCRGRCMEVNESYPCGCTDECTRPGARCCEDYLEICTQSPESERTENPEENSMSITTSSPVKVKTSPKSEETTSIQTATFPFTAAASPITISFSAKTTDTMPTTPDTSYSITRRIHFPASETPTSNEFTSTPLPSSTIFLITSTTPFTTLTKLPMTTTRPSITSTTPSTTSTTPSATSIATSTTLTTRSPTSTISSISSTAPSASSTTPSTTLATPSSILTISSAISAVPSTISAVPITISTVTSTSLPIPTSTTSRTSNSISTRPSTKATTSFTTSTKPSTTFKGPLISPDFYTTSFVKPFTYSTIFRTTSTTPFTTSVRPPIIAPITFTSTSSIFFTPSTFTSKIMTTTTPSATIPPVSKPAVPIYNNSPSTKANQWYTTVSPVTDFENHETTRYNLRPRYRTFTPYLYRTTPAPYLYRTTPAPYRYRTNKPLIYYRFTTQPYYYRVTTKSTTRMFVTRPTTRQLSTTKRTYITTPRYTTSSITPSTKLVFKASSTTKTVSTTTEVSPVAKETQHTSTTASNNSRSTVTIVSVLFMIGVCIAGALIFYIRRWKARRQSKIADDSEMRFLYENEVIEFSDSSALDRINFNDPSN